MKKMALLFTILCAGQLYGMETQKMGSFGDLPEDVHKEIVKALATSNNLKQTIEAVKVAGILQGVRYDNLEDFTKLVHILADKFNVSTMEVASEFKTLTAKKYDDLTMQVLSLIMTNRLNINNLDQLTKDGLDVNATYAFRSESLLGRILMSGTKPEIVKLLLDAGANPHYKDNEGKTALDYAKQQPMNREEIVKLLEEAMQK